MIIKTSSSMSFFKICTKVKKHRYVLDRDHGKMFNVKIWLFKWQECNMRYWKSFYGPLGYKLNFCYNGNFIIVKQRAWTERSEDRLNIRSNSYSKRALLNCLGFGKTMRLFNYFVPIQNMKWSRFFRSNATRKTIYFESRHHLFGCTCYTNHFWK